MRYLGLALTTCSMLLLQLYLTRVFTVLFHSSFAFLAISLAFLGLGSAGVFAYLASKWFPPDKVGGRVALTGLVYSILIGAGFYLLLKLDASMMHGVSGDSVPLNTYMKRVAFAGGLMLPSFFCAGIILSLLFRHHVRDVTRLYFADLLGAGIGCVLVLPLLSVIGGDPAIFFVCALAAGGAACLAISAAKKALAGVSLLATAAFVGLLVANDSLGLVQIRSHTTNTGGAGTQRSRDKAVKPGELYSAWNSFSRIGIFETHGGRELYVRIDSSCQTSIPVYSEESIEAHTSELTFERLPYILDRHESYLEIGAGGGAGMLTANNFGAKRIVGVEINDITVDCAKRVFAEKCGMTKLFDRPGVDLEVDEGRSYVTQTDERFETLTITFIQTGAASGSTAFALSEANLFTVEAFHEFMSKLTDDGLFYVYRHGGNQMLRLISIMREVYARLGIDDLKPHLYIAKDPLLNHAVMMASRRPFSAEEIAKLEAESKRQELKVLYSPGPWNDGLEKNDLLDQIRELRSSGNYSWDTLKKAYDKQHNSNDVLPIEHTYLHSADPVRFVDDYFLDISATTDDRPYFFFFSMNKLADMAMCFDKKALEFLGGIVVLLFYLLVGFTALVLVMIVGPLFLKRRGALQGKGTLAYLVYFGILGVSYISIEVSFIQRFTLFLGHPIYAVSVVLMSFLVFTGVGSYFSDGLFKRGFTLPRTLIALGALLVAFNWLLPAVFHSSLIGLPVIAKIGVSAALIFPLAFLMGILFPQGLRRVEKADPELVPWVWGANSATSVVGSIFSLILAIHYGFSAVLYFGVGLYVIALVLMAHPAWRRV